MALKDLERWANASTGEVVQTVRLVGGGEDFWSLWSGHNRSLAYRMTEAEAEQRLTGRGFTRRSVPESE